MFHGRRGEKSESQDTNQQMAGFHAMVVLFVTSLSRSSGDFGKSSLILSESTLGNPPGEFLPIVQARRADDATKSASTSWAEGGQELKELDAQRGEANADATHKSYCDKEMAESTAKKEALNAEIAKLSTKVDTMSTKSAQLKREAAVLQKALVDHAASQSAMTQLRAKEKAAFETSKKDLEDGLEVIREGSSIFRETHAAEDKAPSAAEGGATGIIGLLEGLESDFSKDLAQITTIEESAAAEYDKVFKENEVEKTNKHQDLKYKSKQAAGLDKVVTELSSYKKGVQSKLGAIVAYLSDVEKQCIVVPDTYATRKSRDQDELAGLQEKEALAILEGGEVLPQRTSRRTLRGFGTR